MAKLNIRVIKSKSIREIDTDSLSEAVYAEALALGLGVLLNRGATKCTKAAHPSEEAYSAAADEIADAQLVHILGGTIKFSGAKSKSKESGEVMTEARRLAKNIVKDQMKRAGYKISHVEAKVITAAANELLSVDPTLIETAKANIETRKATPVLIDIKSLIKESPVLVAAAEAKKAKDKANRPLSAKQAGKPKARKSSVEATA